MASRYRGLRAYRIAVELAGEVRSHVLTWDRFDRWSLGLQLVRAIELTGEQRELFRRLADTFDGKVTPQENKGFFDKVKDLLG